MPCAGWASWPLTQTPGRRATTIALPWRSARSSSISPGWSRLESFGVGGAAFAGLLASPLGQGPLLASVIPVAAGKRIEDARRDLAAWFIRVGGAELKLRNPTCLLAVVLAGISVATPIHSAFGFGEALVAAICPSPAQRQRENARYRMWKKTRWAFPFPPEQSTAFECSLRFRKSQCIGRLCRPLRFL
jgi:hypothetical protein